METETKWIATSKTFWGVIITVLGVVATQFGWTWFGAISGDLTNAFNTIVTLVGSVLSIYGRIKADTPATILPK